MCGADQTRYLPQDRGVALSAIPDWCLQKTRDVEVETRQGVEVQRCRQEFQLTQTQMAQNLSAGANQTVILGWCGPFLLMEQLPEICQDRGGRLRPAEQDYHPAIDTRYVLHGGAIRPSARAGGVQLRAQQISQGIDRLYPHGHRTIAFQISSTQREMQGVIDQVAEGIQAKWPPLGMNRVGAVQLDRLLVEGAVLD